MRTIFVKPRQLEQKWYLVDAENKTLGRLAVKIAGILRGKHKPEFAPHMEMGDHVVVVNAEKIRVTGKKLSDKLYYRHSGYPGGLRVENLGTKMAHKPTFALEHAVKGMLPHGPLGRKLFGNLKVYAGPQHPHAAQQPVALKF